MSVYTKVNNGQTNNNCCRDANGPQSFNINTATTDTGLYFIMDGDDGTPYGNALLDAIENLFDVEEVVAGVFADESNLENLLNSLIGNFNTKSPCPDGYTRKFKVTINSKGRVCTKDSVPNPKIDIDSIEIGPCESPFSGGNDDGILS